MDVSDSEGLKLTESERKFGLLSVLGLAMSVVATWVSALTSSDIVLVNGGTGVGLWVFVINMILSLLVYLSIAEMVSMVPKSGGQFYWWAAFAPRPYKKFGSWMIGCLEVLAWQAYNASATYPAGQLILSLTAGPATKPWVGMVVMTAIGASAVFVNIVLTTYLAILEGVFVILVFLSFFVVAIPLWVAAPSRSARDIFFDFQYYGGWPTAAAWLINLGLFFGSFVGADAAAHIAQEAKDATRGVPRMMILAVLLGGVLGLAMVVTYFTSIQDIDAQIITSGAPFPFIDIFTSATGSKELATVMTVMILVVTIGIAISATAIAARVSWAFGRSRGLPHAIGRLDKICGTPTPLSALVLTAVCNFGFSLLALGGDTAFDSIYGIGEGAACLVYALTIGCLCWYRQYGGPLPERHFSLGRFGMACNLIALSYLLLVSVLIFFPLYARVDAATMNWGFVPFTLLFTSSALGYRVKGRHVFVCPG